MRVSGSSDVLAMSHFKVLLKAHTVPRLLTGHKGEVYVGVSVRLKERKTDREAESKKKGNEFGFREEEREIRNRRMEGVPEGKWEPKNKGLCTNCAELKLLFESISNKPHQFGESH